jgi:hypothetical protein
MRIRLFVSIILICAFAYCIMAQTNDDNTEKYFSGMHFPNFEEPNSGLAHTVSFRDTLEISVEFSECGEWGGRKERIIIFRNESKNIKARFTIDTVSCENIVVKNGVGVLDDNKRIIKKDITTTLTQEDERLINLFIHRILELSLNFNLDDGYTINEDGIVEEGIEIFIFSDSGTHIQIKNSSKEFYLSFYNLDQLANTWYGKVRQQLFGTLINEN